MKVLLIWDGCDSEPRLFEVTGTEATTVIAAHGYYVNSVDRSSPQVEAVTDMIYGAEGEGPLHPSFVEIDGSEPIQNPGRFDRIVIAGLIP